MSYSGSTTLHADCAHGCVGWGVGDQYVIFWIHYSPCGLCSWLCGVGGWRPICHILDLLLSMRTALMAVQTYSHGYVGHVQLPQMYIKPMRTFSGRAVPATGGSSSEYSQCK